MRGSTVIITAAIAATATVGLLAVNGHADRRRTTAPRAQVGPDVVAWTIAGENGFDMDYYGSDAGIGGYAIATQSCNFGDIEANWFGGTDQTPMISQNAFRLMNGRFEQIGISWLKHSFCAVSEPGCGTCQATDCNTLGIGCADTYWAGLNANGEGPRSDVNAFTGVYNYPFTVNSSGPGSTRANLQIADADVEPSLNPNARYFVEAQYVTQDDADWDNQWNNASYREIGFSGPGNPFALNNNGIEATIEGDPAIRAWALIDSSVVLTEALAPADGLVLVGAKVTDNGNGTYQYEYAIQNLNCHRSIGSVSIPDGGATITNVGFHDVNYHSGEIYDGTDWSNVVSQGTILWNTATHSQDPNANALRWGSLYNFRFTATAAPVSGDIELGLFRPGGDASFVMNTLIPDGGGPVDPCTLPLGDCPADIDGDGIVAVTDILEIIGNYGDCGDGTYRPVGDVDGDCCVTVSDVLAVVGVWGSNCAPVGACCFGNGTCSEGLTAADCAAANGSYVGDDVLCASANCPQLGACCYDDGSCADLLATDCLATAGGYQGQGSSCETMTCPVAGAGDECSNPLPAANGANAFETVTATPSGNPPSDASCTGTYLDWGNSADIWFSYVPSASGLVHFTTCDSASYDTSMVLYQGACDNQVACNGDGNGDNGCQGYYSAFDYDVTAGETYYIRIGGWQGDTGSGTLTIE